MSNVQGRVRPRDEEGGVPVAVDLSCLTPAQRGLWDEHLPRLEQWTEGTICQTTRLELWSFGYVCALEDEPPRWPPDLARDLSDYGRMLRTYMGNLRRGREEASGVKFDGMPVPPGDIVEAPIEAAETGAKSAHRRAIQETAMRVEFRDHHGVLTDVVSLGADGVARLEPGGRMRPENLAATNVYLPGNPKAQKPEDGEDYLRALPFTFRGPYSTAALVDDQPPPGEGTAE
jgi:hypothetical protein